MNDYGYSADLNYPDKPHKTWKLKRVYIKLGWVQEKNNENKTCLKFQQN